VSAVLADVAWAPSRLAEGLDVLVRHGGLSQSAVVMPRPPPDLRDPDLLSRWVEDIAAWRGVEAEHVETTYAQLETFLRRCGPAIQRIPGFDLETESADEDDAQFLLLLPSRSRMLRALGPDLVVREIDAAPVVRAACGRAIGEEMAAVDRLLEGAKIGGRRLRVVRRHLFDERFGGTRIGGCWVLRDAPHASFGRILWRASSRNVVTLVASHALEYGLWIAAWWLLGRGALDGYLDHGWMWGWGLLLLAIVPFRMLGTSAQAKVAVAFGQALKQRLLHGSFRLPTDALRTEGAGMLLGRVVEAEAVEALAMSGGLLGLVSAIELVASAAIMAAGASRGLLLTVFAAWIALALGLGRRYFVELSEWTKMRLSITHDVVEKMVGHRTRAAQQPAAAMHEGEDELLDSYFARSAVMDRTSVWLGLLPTSWLVVAILALLPAFAGQSSQASLAASLGGILLASGALGRLTAGAASIARAAVAWRKVDPLLRAASEPPAVGVPLAAADRAGSRVASLLADERPLARPPAVLEAGGIVYRHAGRHEPVLRDCTLRIGHGDRVLLDGRSGAGKSTLAAVLAGLRVPQSGLVLLHGLDRQTVGVDAWRRAVVMTPQFHENHVVSESFAFNLFMGSRWPARPSDLARAKELCKELGLGDLLERMPGGILQMIGETGWQLSHGERSRLFIARALLQRPDLLILDESFGALDPENFQRALDSVERRVPTLLVITHP
jgi:ATP-binding cassette subfamily B protein